MENHHFEWVNPLFQWSFSIAVFVYQRVTQYCAGRLILSQSGLSYIAGLIVCAALPGVSVFPKQPPAAAISGNKP